ncbi:hypothetical protein N8459_02475 [Nitrosopumilus sp.]|nr:hypothetical protein [Nitrosopumilus sp.]
MVVWNKNQFLEWCANDSPINNQVTELDLSNSQLKDDTLNTLFENIGNLTQLYELSLNNNQLTTLPENIINITQLRSLYLGFNKLTTIFIN